MIKSINNSEQYTWASNCQGWHLLKSPTLSVIQERMPSNSREILHFHRFSQQMFYILSGEATFVVNGIEQIVKANESIHIPPLTLHQISNNAKEDLEFLLVSEPSVQTDRIEIIEYSDEYKEALGILNSEWLEKYFRVLEKDKIQFANPKEEIIDKGGYIFYAKFQNQIVGSFSLEKMTEDTYLFAKMAVSPNAQGMHIGNALMDFCDSFCKNNGINKLVLYSNTILGAAIHLYKKYGYSEVELDAIAYERSNIKMEKSF